jgi:hypothetical protein
MASAMTRISVGTSRDFPLSDLKITVNHEAQRPRLQQISKERMREQRERVSERVWSRGSSRCFGSSRCSEALALFWHPI